MCLLKLPVQLSLPHKNRQIVFIDPLLEIIVVFPDKAALLAILRNGRIPEKFSVLILRIEVKQEESSRIQIIIHQGKDFHKIPRFCQVIHGIAGTDNRPDRAVKLELTHILKKI